MTINQQREVERLVSAMHDDGLSPAEAERLEKLLLNSPDLQTLYFSLVDVHIGLGVASPAIAKSESPLGHAEETAAPPLLGGSSTPAWWPSGQVVVFAVLTLFGFSVWFWDPVREPGEIGLSAAEQDVSLSHIPVITRVSWNGTTFSSDASEWRPFAIAGDGVVPLQQNFGEVVDGYLLRLPPGYEVEVITTCDATAENCLSIEELWTDPTPSSRKVTFHNSGEGVKPLHANPNARHRRYGIVGTWSDTNSTSRARFFLLTGVHKRVGAEPGEEWRVSDMAVIVEETNVVHIGWDDGGPFPSVEGDRDFDDLSASIMLRPVFADSESIWTGDLSERQKSEFANTYFKESGVDSPGIANLADLEAAQYRIELPPQSITILKAASNASAHNELLVIDSDGVTTLWQTSNENGTLTNLGGAAIPNRSQQPRVIELLTRCGVRTDDDSDEGRQARTRLLFSQSGYSILGFDDGVRPDSDFDDVRVGVLQIPFSAR